MDAFQEINDEDIPKLRCMLEADLPRSVHAYYYLQTALEWKRKAPEYGILLLAPFSDFSDSTFLIFSLINGSYIGTVYSNSEIGLQHLRRALLETKRISWTNGIFFTCLEPSVAEVILPVIKAKCPTAIANIDQLYYMTADEATRMVPKLQKGTHIAALSGSKHSQEINEAWVHKFPGSEKCVADQIDLNWGLGVFDDSTGKLFSWGLISFYGGLGIVQTKQGKMGQGHGSAVVAALANKAAELGYKYIHLNVVGSNENSKRFFEKLGFRKYFNPVWIFCNFFQTK